MAIDLTSRQVRSVEWLLAREGSASVAEMADALRLSPRMVRSDMDAIERFLSHYSVALRRRRGVGVWLEGDGDALLALNEAMASLDAGDALRVLSQADRLTLALFALLAAAPEPITVDQMRRTLQISVTSARRDVTRAEEWLSVHGLFLARQPGVGMSVIATETALRNSLVKLLLETVPSGVIASPTPRPDWWRVSGISAGLREFLRELPLAACREIVNANQSLRVQAESGHPWLAADLAVTVFRIRNGRDLQLEPGSLRSLRDHPVWDTAKSIAPALSELAGAPVSDDEIGGITEHLLGLVELDVDRVSEKATDDLLVTEALDLAAQRLHPSLADDQELLSSLSDHVVRLRVRLQYGLPVHNPLLAEVSSRYPEAHAVALEIAEGMSRHIGSPVSLDEAGFVTMYLSGAMERLRLKPRTRAVVMCPAGIATAWILVSRIQAEFPELDLVDVLSAGSVEQDRDIDADLIISTVDIGPELDGVPVIVVGALLREEDTRRIAQSL